MRRRVRIIGWIPVAAPGVIVALVYIAWAVAFWQLGRRPMPSMDDPKDIGGISSDVSDFVSLLILPLLVLWAVSILTVAGVGLLPKTTERKWWCWRLATGLAAMMVLLLSIRLSPGDALSWILD